MKSLLSLLLIFLCNVNVNAQMLPIQYDTNFIHTEIIISANGEYAGNSVQRDLSSKFFYGGTITSEMKQASFDRHGGINRFGIDISGDAEYCAYDLKLFKKKDWGMIFKGGYSAFGGMIYSKDLFGLAMYGNAMYLGDTIDMSGFDASFTSFQKIGFGFIDRKSKSSATLNFYNIDSRVRAHFRDFTLAQDADGSYVNLVMDGQIELAQNQKFTQGLGVGFDVDFKIPISWSSKNTSFLQFQAKNVGVGFMIEDQVKYQADTTFNYSGFRFDQIMGDNSILNDSINVLDTLGISKSTTRPVFLLPGFVQVGKLVDNMTDQKIQAFYGLRVYPTLIYSPLIFAGVDYKPLDWMRIGAQLSYGGFAGFKAGLYSNFEFGKCTVGLGTQNLVGMISKQGSGQSVMMRLRCAF